MSTLAGLDSMALLNRLSRHRTRNLSLRPMFSSFRERLQLYYHIPLEFLVKRISPFENDNFAFCTSITRKHFIACTGVAASERLLILVCTTTFRSLGLGLDNSLFRFVSNSRFRLLKDSSPSLSSGEVVKKAGAGLLPEIHPGLNPGTLLRLVYDVYEFITHGKVVLERTELVDLLPVQLSTAFCQAGDNWIVIESSPEGRKYSRTPEPTASTQEIQNRILLVLAGLLSLIHQPLP
ncbi:hypothetical protein NM208_g16430 [Fusarium decemcellulare]|uniref:Uncharacterized protein n=1 Tax=Fusarium decemcellulare TaxID=57161 RepID=A0ACC1RC38_9HYPO|nr:hypothetical protein NM208_g16430 [Fusarium decemcellulare]